MAVQHYGLTQWINPLFSPFLSRRAAANRLIQAKVAQGVGLNVPDMIVSNSSRKMKEFLRKGPAINKQIAQGAVSESGPLFVRTSLISEHDLHETDRDEGCPILIQRYIDKDYEIRATVVGSNVFAAAIDTKEAECELVDSRDWIESDITYYRTSLSDEEEQMLLHMNAHLGLSYSAFDLVRDRSGKLIFLETNPSGQWGFVESLTGYAITESIVKELISGK